MPPVVRKTDNCSGHGCFPPRPSVIWSPNVFANGLEVERQTDALDSHCCGVCHDSIWVGKSSVYVNGKPIQVIGSPIACGSKGNVGSPNVFANLGG